MHKVSLPALVLLLFCLSNCAVTVLGRSYHPAVTWSNSSLHKTSDNLRYIDVSNNDDNDNKPKIFTHYWAVEIKGGAKHAQEIARKHDFDYLGELLPDIYHFAHRRIAKRSTSPSTQHHKLLSDEPGVIWLEQQVAKVRVKRKRRGYMNDEKWEKMWYLNHETDFTNRPDMNIKRVWEEGVHGQGIVVCVLDDGIEKDHPDLKKNYDPEASFDANSNDQDPSARPTKSDENKHGTRCAGQIAAYGNNTLCIPGVAFKAKIGAIRMLDGDVSDTIETTALSFKPQYIHIYSSSWGPEDDGRTVDGPGALTQKAFKKGVEEGRGGLGSIYVWASGNGGRKGDNCNTDGYTNSIYTLSVNSVSEQGRIPWYSEPCSSTLAATYSSGDETKERAIITTDLRGQCTEKHTGTSASAPMAAGICALVLSVNRGLTWRDMQHLVVRTANPSTYLKAGDWRPNAVGRNVSHYFGYGLMDALAMVRLARNWTRVPEQHICQVIPDASRLPAYINEDSSFTMSLTTDGCLGTANHVKYLEHVQAKIKLLPTTRGDVQIFLKSPMGTVSNLLTKRFNDKVSNNGFHLWPFMTVHNWGELANGTWQLTIQCGACTATFHGWSLLLYGTQDLAPSQVMPAVPQPHREDPMEPLHYRIHKQGYGRERGISYDYLDGDVTDKSALVTSFSSSWLLIGCVILLLRPIT